MRWLVTVALSLVTGTHLLSGCAGPQIIDRDDVHVVVAGPSDGGMDAQLIGRLAVLEGGCLGIENEGIETLVAWPSGVDVSDESPPTLTLGDTTYRVGDEVAVGGGNVQIGTSTGLPDVPSGCGQGEIFMVNGG